MPDTVTVTGTLGPGLTATSLIISDVQDIFIDTIASVIRVTGTIGNNPAKTYEFNIFAQNTVSVTKSGFTWTITISA